MDFLTSFAPRSIELNLPNGFSQAQLYLSEQSRSSLEVVVITSVHKPTRTDLTNIWKGRHENHHNHLVLIVLHNDNRASICGPFGENPKIFQDIDVGLTKRLAEAALQQKDRLSLRRFLNDALPTLETELPGIVNEGMVALHNLTTTARNRNDWNTSQQKAQKAIQYSGEKLLTSLGYSITPLDNLTKATSRFK